MPKENKVYRKRTPQVGFLFIYIFCALPLLYTRNSIAEHLERTSHIGFYIGLAVWLFAFLLLIKYYFLPDYAIIQLKKHGKVIKAEIVGDSHSAFSGLPPFSAYDMALADEVQFRKKCAERRLKVQFTNLSGTLITHIFSMPVDYSFSPDLQQVIAAQNRDLAIEFAHDHQATMPVWLNTKAVTPVFALANDHGRLTAKHIYMGLALLIITLLQMLLPLWHVAQTTRHLTDDMFTLFNTVNVWHWGPLCNIGVLWMYHSHRSVAKGPNGMPVDVIKILGRQSTTESITWKQTYYSNDDAVYRVDISYQDESGRLQRFHYSEPVSDEQKIQLEMMSPHRPILYLAHQPDKILFLDRPLGRFL